jgi:hypothetical protein
MDREQFQRRVAAGGEFFQAAGPRGFPAEKEAWMHGLFEAVASCMTGANGVFW